VAAVRAEACLLSWSVQVLLAERIDRTTVALIPILASEAAMILGKSTGGVVGSFCLAQLPIGPVKTTEALDLLPDAMSIAMRPQGRPNSSRVSATTL